MDPIYNLTETLESKVEQLISLGFQEIRYSWTVDITPSTRRWNNTRCQVCILQDSNGKFYAKPVGWFTLDASHGAPSKHYTRS